MLTKAFAGMLDNNGFIDGGDIIFNDDSLTDVCFAVGAGAIAKAEARLNELSKLELGAAAYREIKELERDHEERLTLSGSDAAAFDAEHKELTFRRTQAQNLKQTLDRSREKAKIKEISAKIADYDAQIKQLESRKKASIREHAAKTKADAAYNAEYGRRMSELKERYARECAGEISAETRERNKVLAKEICLSLGRYPIHGRRKLEHKLYDAIKTAMTIGADLGDDETLNRIFENAVFRVKYLGEENGKLHGSLVLNLARSDCVSDWTKIRGQKIATIFQDPMTSLNPIMTIGKQITSVIMKHQNVSELEARKRAIILMKKVGIPNAENRFDDYPFQYSGGMRQRIVIAIALLPAEDTHLRRAYHRPGRHDTGADNKAHQGFAKGVRLHHRVHHARPRRRGQRGRPRGGALRRADNRAGHRGGGLLRPPPPLHLGAFELAAPAHGQGHEALLHRRHAAEPLQRDSRRRLCTAQPILPARGHPARAADVQGLGHALRQDLAARPARA